MITKKTPPGPEADYSADPIKIEGTTAQRLRMLHRLSEFRDADLSLCVDVHGRPRPSLRRGGRDAGRADAAGRRREVPVRRAPRFEGARHQAGGFQVSRPGQSYAMTGLPRWTGSVRRATVTKRTSKGPPVNVEPAVCRPARSRFDHWRRVQPVAAAVRSVRPPREVLPVLAGRPARDNLTFQARPAPGVHLH